MIAGYVYCVTNTVNGYRYVGATTSTPENRWEQHKAAAMARGRRKRWIFHQAIRKHGPGAFFVETIGTAATVRGLLALEVECIARLGTKVPKGYNMSDGGEMSGGAPIVVDGVEYPSITRASEVFGVAYKNVVSRLKKGWTIRETFGIDPAPREHAKPFAAGGVTYASQAEAARANGIAPATLHNRLKHGWTPERALDAGASARSIRVGGRDHRSVNKAAAAHGLAATTVLNRLRRGWTPEQALGLADAPGSLRVAGRLFDNVTEACAHHGVDRGPVFSRLRRGWTPEQALGLDAPPGAFRYEHGGVVHTSVASLARAVGLEPRTVSNRLARGWTVEQAAGLAGRGPRWPSGVARAATPGCAPTPRGPDEAGMSFAEAADPALSAKGCRRRAPAGTGRARRRTTGPKRRDEAVRAAPGSAPRDGCGRMPETWRG